MFTTAGAVSRVAVGSETQSKGTYATAAIEFESPLENRELLRSMEGMNVPGGHPAGLKFIDWDTKKHFKLFGKKQRAAVETAGRSAAVVDLADASPGSDQNRDEDSPETAAADGDATGWAAVEPEPEPDIPVSVRLAREEETRAAQLAAERANAEAKDAEDDLISLGGDESDHFDDDAGEEQDATYRSVTPEPPAGDDDDDDDKEEDKDKEPPARYAAYESGAKEEDKDEDEETDDDKEDRRPSYKNRARSRSASRDNNAGHPSGRQPQSQRDGPPGRQRFSNGGDWGAPASGPRGGGHMEPMRRGRSPPPGRDFRDRRDSRGPPPMPRGPPPVGTGWDDRGGRGGRGGPQHGAGRYPPRSPPRDFRGDRDPYGDRRGPPPGPERNRFSPERNRFSPPGGGDRMRGPPPPRGPAPAQAPGPDRNATATLDEATTVFLSRSKIHQLCCVGPDGPGTGSGKDVDRALEALRQARGAIVRVGVGGGRYQVGELAGGAQAPLADADTDQGPTHPVLRLIDERDQVVERAHSLGVISNSAPTRAEWGAYVDACRNGGMPPPRVGDVDAAKAALDRVFLVGEQVGFGSAPFSAGAARGVGRSPPRDVRRNVSPPREFGRAPREMPRDGPNGGGRVERRSRSPPPRDRGPIPAGARGGDFPHRDNAGWERGPADRGDDFAPYDRPPRRDSRDRGDFDRPPPIRATSRDRGPPGGQGALRRRRSPSRDRSPRSPDRGGVRSVRARLGSPGALPHGGGSHPHGVGAAAAELDVDPAHPAEWLVDTRGNNGLIVGPKGSHIKNIENVTKASVDAERDGTTVIVRGAVPDVIRAREMIEDALTRNGIDFRGKPGRGFPREDRENPEGRAAGGAETRGGGPGGDLRGLLKRKSLDADAAAAPPKAKKGPAAAANRADDPTEWMQAELEKMKARATRFGLPPPTMDDVRAKNPHKVSDKKVSDTGTVDKGYVDDDETVVVPVADKHTMSRVIGKKRSVLSMMCKVADCSMIVGNKEMAVRVRCPDAVRRAHAVALLDAVIGDEIAGARITFHGLQAAFAAIQSGAPTPKADQADEAAAADAKKGKGKGGVMSRLQGDDQGDDQDDDEDEDADDADEERPKKRQVATFKFQRIVDPRGFLGAVIGKNGGTIKKLEKVTKTKMDVDQEAKTVEVKSDSARATARGCELIESIIVSCERTKSERAAGKKTEKFVLGDILQSAIARWKNGDGDGDEKSAPEPWMNDAVDGSPEDTAAAEAGETPAEEPEGTEAEAPEPVEAPEPDAGEPGKPEEAVTAADAAEEKPAKEDDAPAPVEEEEEEKPKPATKGGRGGRGRGRGAAKGRGKKK